jgi:hypothetical protein
VIGLDLKQRPHRCKVALDAPIHGMEGDRLPDGRDRLAWRKFVRSKTRKGLIPIDVHLTYGGTNANEWRKLLSQARRWQDALLKTEDRNGFPLA